MDVKAVTKDLRRRLDAAGLPAQSPRLNALFEALHRSPRPELPALAKLAGGVVDALIDPKRRESMWAKVDSLSPEAWRNLAAKQSTRSGSGSGSGRTGSGSGVRKASGSGSGVRSGSSSGRSRRGDRPPSKVELERRIRTALLGVLGQAVQGAGHLGLELERLVKAGATAKGSPVSELLRRLQAPLGEAEKRKEREMVSALAHVAGQVLNVVEEHPNRVAELVDAFDGAGPDELRHVANRLQELRERDRDKQDSLIGDLGLAVVDSAALEAIVERIVSLPVFKASWKSKEQAVAQSLLVHLRQGEQLRGEEDVMELANRTSTNKRRHVRAYARASRLIAQLLLTERREKTPIWWERIVQSSLREIEIDSLGAKRFRAGAQQRMAAKALQAIPADATGAPRDATADKLTKLIQQLEGQLAGRPGDANLKHKIAKTKDLLARHEAGQKARTRQALARLAKADPTKGSDQSEDWLFEMD